MGKIQTQDQSKLLTVSNLKELTESIIQDHLEFLTAKIYLFEKGIVLGRKLIRLKDGLPHGKFMVYVKENLPMISRATSNRYMSLAENELELREKLGSDLELKKAYQYLRTKSTKSKPSKIESNLEKAIDSNEQKRNELREKRKLLLRVEKTILQGIEPPEPDRTIARNTYMERLEKINKQKAKYEKLLSQITHSE